MNKKILGIVIILIIAVSVFIIFSPFNSDEKQVKEKQNKNKSWETKNTKLLSFQYPAQLNYDFTSLQKWPPKINIVTDSNNWPSEVSIDNKLNCKGAPKEESFPKKVTQKTIKGRNYCVKEKSEGAAGSVYTKYTYSTLLNGNLVTLNFTLQFPQCGNYPKDKRINCKKQRETFDIDGVIKEITDSISFRVDISHREKSMMDYLLTQKRFSWKSNSEGHRFCVIDNLGSNKSFPLYIWTRCSKFSFQNGKLKELNGSSLPLKIDYPDELSYFDINKFSHKAPGEGSHYTKDVKEIFPKEIQDKIFNYQKKEIDEINKKLRSVASSWFNSE